MNSLNNLPFNWFDIVLVAMLVLGVVRGRKQGMSVEIFPLTLWVMVVLACSFGYEPLGQWLSTLIPMGLLSCYLLSYLSIALVIALIFFSLKKALGEKMINAESFGKAEYYLGIPAGLLRFACILLTFLALMNARYFTTKEIKDREAYQKDVYGSEFFPGFSTLQLDVFEHSMTGPYIRKYASFLLIKQTPPEQHMVVHARDVSLP